MGVVLAGLAALLYGASDFAGGVGGRRSDPNAVCAVAQAVSLVVVAGVVLVGVPRPPSAAMLGWGALSGLGGGGGVAALYRGLAAGQMHVVAPLSGVVSAAVPAVVGLGLGERLSAVVLVGIALTVPAIVLVSLQSGEHATGRWSGVGYGLVAGAGFALLFIALERAGTAAGDWPLLAGQVTASAVVVTLAAGARLRPGTWRSSWALGLTAGALGAVSNLLYVASTRRGVLAVVAVVTALYPAVTVLLARVLLDERWGRRQVVGLGLAVVAVGMISGG